MAATIILTGGELPAEGAQFCLVCVRLHKGVFLELPHIKAKIAEWNALDSSQVRHLPLVFPAGMSKPMLNEAVTMAVVTLPITTPQGQGQASVPAPVCWNHVEGLIIRDGIMAYPAGAMPMERGAVDLSQRRRPGG